MGFVDRGPEARCLVVACALSVEIQIEGAVSGICGACFAPPEKRALPIVVDLDFDFRGALRSGIGVDPVSLQRRCLFGGKASKAEEEAGEETADGRCLFAHGV